MGYLHPEALDGVGGDVPDAVTVGSTTYSVGVDGVVDCERAVAARMASAHGVDVDRLSVSGDAPQTDAEEPESDTVEPGETICTCGVDEACDSCGGQCPTVKADHEVCGRDRPCSYHD